MLYILAKAQRSPGFPALGFAINQFAWENARLGKIARCPLLQIRDICAADPNSSFYRPRVGRQMAGRLKAFEAPA